MRGGLHGLPVAHPIGERLPAVYAEDDFAQRMTSALDDVLAPVFATLDCFPDYLDPILAPVDFVDWLAGWVAFSMDEGWTLAQRRALVANAVELHRWRGTVRGLTAHVRLLTLGDVEIVDSGACTVSPQPSASVDSRDPHIEVRVAVPDPRTIDGPRLLAAIVEAAPAHVMVSLTVSGADPGRGASGRGRASVAVPPATPVVPPQALAPDPEGLRTGQLQQPGTAPPPPPQVAAPVSAPPASDKPPTGPPRQAGGRARGVARPPGSPAPEDPGAPPRPADGEGPR